MSNEHLETDALDTLIKALEEYQENLATNRQILQNAANVCDVAMGSDDIAKKNIQRLEDALVELAKTSEIAREVAEALVNEKIRAEDIVENT